MYKTLRIVFCVLAVACVAVTVFIFAYFKMWGFLPLGGAVACAALMMLFKNKQEKEEAKLSPPAPQGDFITGKAPSAANIGTANNDSANNNNANNNNADSNGGKGGKN